MSQHLAQVGGAKQIYFVFFLLTTFPADRFIPTPN